MYELWYDFVKPKYGENAKIWNIDIHSFLVHVKTKFIYKDITENMKKRFDTSSFELDRPFPKGKNKTEIRLMKDELSGQNHEGICWSKNKTYSS